MSGGQTLAMAMRDVAEWLRHAPGVRALNPLWRRLQKPYLAVLRRATGDRGVPVRIGGESLRLDIAYASVSWEHMEAPSLAAFRAAATPGSVVVDVGAHIGSYALLAARCVGPAGHVFAFEPIAGTRAMLEKHLVWNGVRDLVTVRDAACSDAVGELTLHITDDVADAEAGPRARDGSRAVLVPRTTLDRETARLGRPVSLVKIDVEGQELAVLRGAAELVARDRPTLLISVHPLLLRAQGLAPADVFAWLGAAGYAHRIIAEDHEVHVLATPPAR